MGSLRTVLFPSLLCSVASLGDTDRLAALASYQADWDAADYRWAAVNIIKRFTIFVYSCCSGRTALHTAAEAGRVEAVRWLLGRGASLHTRDHRGETPLVVAVRAGQVG